MLDFISDFQFIYNQPVLDLFDTVQRPGHLIMRVVWDYYAFSSHEKMFALL